MCPGEKVLGCQLEATCRYPIGVNDSNSLLTSHFLKFPQSVALEYLTMPHIYYLCGNELRSTTIKWQLVDHFSISSFYAYKERSQVAAIYMISPGIRLWVLTPMERFT
jgi:hypothetical protein